MWSTLCDFVVGAVLSDIGLNSLFRLQRHCMSLVFLLMSFEILHTVNINLTTDCIKFSPIPESFRDFLKEGWPITSGINMMSQTYNVWALYLMVVCFLFSNIDYILYRLLSEDKLNNLLDSIYHFRNFKRYHKFVLTYTRIKRDSLIWASGFITSEIVALIVPIFQFQCLYMLLDGQFEFLVTENWKAHQEMFPILVTSTTSESNQSHDLLCMIPNNKLFEVMVFHIWLWLTILVSLSVLGFICLLVTFYHFRLSSFNQFLLSNSGPALSTLPQVSKSRLEKMSNIIPFSEWLYIFHICNNSDRNSIEVLLRNCCNELNLEDNAENIVDSTSEEDSHHDP